MLFYIYKYKKFVLYVCTFRLLHAHCIIYKSKIVNHEHKNCIHANNQYTNVFLRYTKGVNLVQL